MLVLVLQFDFDDGVNLILGTNIWVDPLPVTIGPDDAATNLTFFSSSSATMERNDAVPFLVLSGVVVVVVTTCGGEAHTAVDGETRTVVSTGAPRIGPGGMYGDGSRYRGWTLVPVLQAKASEFSFAAVAAAGNGWSSF